MAGPAVVIVGDTSAFEDKLFDIGDQIIVCQFYAFRQASRPVFRAKLAAPLALSSPSESDKIDTHTRWNNSERRF